MENSDSNVEIKKDIDISEGEESDNNLKIDFECSTSSPKKRLTSTPKPSECEKVIIESIEDELEKQLTEKAAKIKLNAVHVKNIIRHVVTNEHVLALIRQAENPEDVEENITVYEPKLTRSKAKELLKSNPVIPTPWATATKTKPPSGTHVLVGEDLQEDSSGEEYVPGDDESEDEKESSVSEVESLSLPPPTPPTPVVTEDMSTQTHWSEDGVFKIPLTCNAQNEEANIALRTRSKINLSSTPLEVIETSFVPPDVTTDMYDMECDDEDWAEFLKGFMQPIDQLIKGAEDEDHDPEYNIMADEISKIDKEELKEELRVDKAVKVSKKELNLLWEELFEFAEMYANGQDKLDKSKKPFDNSACSGISGCNGNITLENTIFSQDSTANESYNSQQLSLECKEEFNETYILRNQVALVFQQMSQHVQILTQTFFLTYQHPEFHHYSLQQKEYLMNLKLLGQNKRRSAFWPINLEAALALIDNWESNMFKNTESVQQHKLHVNRVLMEGLRQKSIGNFNYVPTFSKLLLETISNSEVFIYPSLLPKIPYKSATFYSNKISFTDSEDRLLAIGLEQFTSLAQESKKNILPTGEVRLKVVCSYIQEYMMPHRSVLQIYTYISSSKQQRCAGNPIKSYFQTKQAPPVFHYVTIINKLIPLCRQPPENLPLLWKNFIYPNMPNIQQPEPTNQQPEPTKNDIPVILSGNQPATFQLPTGICLNYTQIQPNPSQSPTINVTTKKNGKSKSTLKPAYKRRTFSKPRVYAKRSTPLQKFVECLNQASPVEKLIRLYPNYCSTIRTDFLQFSNMLPSMPSLQMPIKSFQEKKHPETIKYKNKSIEDSLQSTEVSSAEQEKCSDIHSIKANEFNDVDSSDMTTNTKDFESKLVDKDNPADINALMVANSTVKPEVKPAGKKEPSGAEKKRAKIRREFLANLSIATPEDPTVEQHKSERFALAYYDKLRETLELEDYHRIMQILNDYNSGDAVDLYKHIEKVLRPKYEELAEEFLLFLREREAAAVGRLIPWIQINARSKFLRKLEIYFKDQPAQLKKIYKCLTELSQSVDITMEKIKTTLLPMLKGNTILTELFLQNFLNERPPSSLLEGSYETVDINKEMGRTADDESFENISVPDAEDKYGGFSCICSCHKIEDPEFKSKSRHCIPCGTRFIQGKVCIQTGRGPKPATVSFLTGKHSDRNARLLGKSIPNTRKKRSDQSPSKHVTSTSSPIKENPEDDTEDEISNKKKPKSRSKSPRKRKKQLDKMDGSQNPKKDIYNSPFSTTSLQLACDNNESDNLLKDCKSRKRTYSMRRFKTGDLMKIEKVDLEGETEEEFVEPNQKTTSEQHALEPEMIECDLNGSGESTEKPSSPGAQTADSESEFCEESSQDNCESDSSSLESSASNTNSQSDTNSKEEWRKEEDKIILETFQQENDKEYAFKMISKKLTNRTIREIRNRFSTLMALLLEQIGKN